MELHNWEYITKGYREGLEGVATTEKNIVETQGLIGGTLMQILFGSTEREMIH